MKHLPFVTLKGALSAAEWKTREEDLKYGPIEFKILHVQAEIPRSFYKTDADKSPSKLNLNQDYFPKTHLDLLDTSQEFSTYVADVHPLVKFYGIREFVVLSPKNRHKELLDENLQNIIFSSLIIATNNTQW